MATELQPMKQGNGANGSVDWQSGYDPSPSQPQPTSFAPVHEYAQQQQQLSSAQQVTGSMGAPPSTSNAAPTQPTSSTTRPAFLPASLFTSPLASAGVSYGARLVSSASSSGISQGLGPWLRGTRLKYYFTVSQTSVTRKLVRVLAPVSGDWNRSLRDDADPALAASSNDPAAAFKPPAEDVNAPDLYVPLMAFITFTVLMGYALGSIDSFDPELLGTTFTRSLVVLLAEVGVIYTIFFLTSAPVAPVFLDLLALCGCKFVALNTQVLCGLLFGRAVFWWMFVLLGISTAIYMIRTLNGWIPSSIAALGGGGNGGSASSSSPSRFRIMVICLALLQLFFALVLVYPALSAVSAEARVSGGGGWWPGSTSSSSSSETSLPMPDLQRSAQAGHPGAGGGKMRPMMSSNEETESVARVHNLETTIDDEAAPFAPTMPHASSSK